MSRDLATRQRRVLIVGATSHLERALADSLEDSRQFAIERLFTAASCLARFSTTGHLTDAVLLSSELEDGDGVEHCARLRSRGITVPLLMMACQPDFATSEIEAVRALDAGANDFLTAPFRPAEVLARLRAQMRAFETSDDAVLMIGPFQFRPARRLLLNMQNGERTRLTEKEAAVLKFLYRADGPVPRTTLLHEVWGYAGDATTHTVETHIYRLRRKIEPHGDSISLLVSESGGYRLRLLAPSRPDHRQRETAYLAAVT